MTRWRDPVFGGLFAQAAVASTLDLVRYAPDELHTIPNLRDCPSTLATTIDAADAVFLKVEDTLSIHRRVARTLPNCRVIYQRSRNSAADWIAGKATPRVIPQANRDRSSHRATPDRVHCERIRQAQLGVGSPAPRADGVRAATSDRTSTCSRSPARVATTAPAAMRSGSPVGPSGWTPPCCHGFRTGGDAHHPQAAARVLPVSAPSPRRDRPRRRPHPALRMGVRPGVPRLPLAHRRALPFYLTYYNTRRRHSGIALQTPAERLANKL